MADTGKLNAAMALVDKADDPLEYQVAAVEVNVLDP
jgi:hypothetical protein